MSVYKAAKVFLGNLQPIQLPFSTQQQSGNSNDMYRMMNMINKQASGEQKAENTFLKSIKDVEGLTGARDVTAYGLLDIESQRKQLKQDAMSKIYNSSLSPAEVQNLTTSYQKSLQELKAKEVEIALAQSDLKDDLVAWKSDADAVLKNGKVGAPKLMMDYGNVTSGSNPNGDDYNLFSSAAKGIVATDANGFMSNAQYLEQARKSTAVDASGRPVKYERIIQSEPEKNYLESIAGKFSKAGTFSSTGFKTANGSINVGDVKEFISGAGFVKTEYSSNASNIKAIMQNMPEMLTASEKNTAAERLIASNSQAAGKTVKDGLITIKEGTNEFSFSGSYSDLSDAIQYNALLASSDKVPVEKRAFAQKVGLTLAKRFNEGVNKQIIIDAYGQTVGRVNQTSGNQIVRNTEQYNKFLKGDDGSTNDMTMKRAIVGLSESFLRNNGVVKHGATTVFTAAPGDKVATAYDFPNRYGKSSSTILQNDIVKTYFGLKQSADMKDPDLKPYLKLKNFGTNIITSGRVISPSKLNGSYGEAEFVGVTDEVVFLPPIMDGKMPVVNDANGKPIQGNTTYITTEWRLPMDKARKAVFYEQMGANDLPSRTGKIEQGMYLSPDPKKTVSVGLMAKSGHLGGEYYVKEIDGQEYVYFKAISQIENSAMLTENPSKFNASYPRWQQQQIEAAENAEAISKALENKYGTKK